MRPTSRSVPAAVTGFSLALGLCMTGCKGEKTEAPTPPDVTALRAAYGPADGRLTPETAPGVAQGIWAKLKQVSRGQSLLTEVTRIADGFKGEDDKADMAESEGGLARVEHGLSGKASGWARLRHICEGFSGQDPPDEDKNGRVDLFALYGTADGLEDVIWGAFEACRLPSGADAKQQLGGELTLDLPELGKEGGIVRFDLTWLDEAGETIPFQLDFQFDPDGELRISQALPDGTHVIASLRADAVSGSHLTVSDAGGTWGCELESEAKHGRCERDAGDSDEGFSF